MAIRTMDINAPKHIVNKAELATFKRFGRRGITEIWFPPYITRMAPTRTEGETTPMSTPTALETAIIDRLMDNDWAVSLRTVPGSAPLVRKSTAIARMIARKLAIAMQE